MNKTTLILLAGFVVLGIIIGSLVTGIMKDREINKLKEHQKEEIEERVKFLMKEIHTRNGKIEELKGVRKMDSLRIDDLQIKIKQDGVRYSKEITRLRKELKTMTPSEKTDWFIRRYSDDNNQ